SAARCVPGHPGGESPRRPWGAATAKRQPQCVGEASGDLGWMAPAKPMSRRSTRNVPNWGAAVATPQVLPLRTAHGPELPDPVDHIGGIDRAAQILDTPDIDRVTSVEQPNAQLASHFAQ